ncbi:MAG: BLUF domain-containing protein [Natronospirillum sp.]|uniref:BLUF domain-containing protein n=1 Tax=Natronospirillum sp. TaxID=2812955 RepID=UPI0025D4E8FA|nr:BLUF domain-containing protein [Natronospirillum sp.]MCH8553348.1 BLUF domain-containing protein [Natronospirillum sp.]
MSDLICVLYISRATFKPLPATKGIEPNVGRILQASRTNNARRGVGGVLFYGDGCFFQCLEGERDIVKPLLETIRQDERHTDIRVVSEQSAKQRYFEDWTMKYTSINDAVKTMLKTHGFERFDPYQFDANHFRALLKTLKDINDEGPADLPDEPPNPSDSDTPKRKAPTIPKTDASNDPLARGLAFAALVVALVALVLALF